MHGEEAAPGGARAARGTAPAPRPSSQGAYVWSRPRGEVFPHLVPKGSGAGPGRREASTAGERHGDLGRVCARVAVSPYRHGSPEQRRSLQQKPARRTPGARRSRSQRRTLMYCCPISAFNWCPLGQATRERGRRALAQQALPAREATSASLGWGHGSRTPPSGSSAASRPAGPFANGHAVLEQCGGAGVAAASDPPSAPEREGCSSALFKTERTFLPIWLMKVVC